MKASNNHMHSDSKKRRSFVALLFAAGDVKRWRQNASAMPSAVIKCGIARRRQHKSKCDQQE